MVMGTHCEAVGGEVFSCAVNAVTRLAAQCPRNLSSVPGMSTFVSYPVLRLTQPAIQWVTWAVLPAPKQCCSICHTETTLIHKPQVQRWSIDRDQTVDRAAHWSLTKFISHLTTINRQHFLDQPISAKKPSTQIKIIQTRYRRRLADQYLQYCLHWCQSDWTIFQHVIARHFIIIIVITIVIVITTYCNWVFTRWH